MKTQVDVMTQQLGVTKRSVEQTQEMLTYANQQANSARTQASIAEESARPSIVIRNISLNNIASNRQPSYSVEIENTGKVTARTLELWAVILLSQTPLSNNPQYPEPATPPSIRDLGVGGTMMVSDTTSWKITAAQFQSTKDQNLWLYLYGFARYNDSDGKQHQMKYCVYYSPNKGNALYCNQHNSSN